LKFQVHVGQIRPDVDANSSHWEVEIGPIANDVPDIRSAGAIDRHGDFLLTVGKRTLQLNLWHWKAILLCTQVKVCRSSVWHSRRVVILYVITIWN
jgi:hypothetical protein